MGVSIELYRSRIGTFNSYSTVSRANHSALSTSTSQTSWSRRIAIFLSFTICLTIFAVAVHQAADLNLGIQTLHSPPRTPSTCFSAGPCAIPGCWPPWPPPWAPPWQSSPSILNQCQNVPVKTQWPPSSAWPPSWQSSSPPWPPAWKATTNQYQFQQVQVTTSPPWLTPSTTWTPSTPPWPPPWPSSSSTMYQFVQVPWSTVSELAFLERSFLLDSISWTSSKQRNHDAKMVNGNRKE